jgi:hypothetical protein
MKESIATYRSYLLRLWQDSPHSLWHASVQSVQTSEVIHFADLEGLISFLWGQTSPARRSELVIGESVYVNHSTKGDSK